jgi:hypothetical protein
VGLDAILHGDAEEDPAVWLEDRLTGERIDLTWPPGTTAVFSPDVEVVLRDGSVFHREGDRIDGACGEGGGELSLIPGE